MSRPEPADVIQLLSAQNSLLVHFSGCPKGGGTNRGMSHLYPNDLLHVLAGNAQGGLSCSTVSPGDNFSGINRHAFGCIGAIVRPRYGHSIVAADHGDAGSSEDRGVRVAAYQPSITIHDLLGTMTGRGPGHHNEWVVRDFDVCGILAVNPLEITVENPAESIPDEFRHLFYGPTTGIDSTTFDEVLSTFANCPVYTMDELNYYRLGSMELATVAEIYASRNFSPC